MEACRIPIELCETIMDALPSWPTISSGDWSRGQFTLCACALTCRAWRVRAQLLLWVCPRLIERRRLPLFTAAIRTAPKALITTLLLHQCSFVSSAELFMHTFPNLQQLNFHNVDFTRGPPSILRMRLPFFASVTVPGYYAVDFARGGPCWTQCGRSRTSPRRS